MLLALLEAEELGQIRVPDDVIEMAVEVLLCISGVHCSDCHSALNHLITRTQAILSMRDQNHPPPDPTFLFWPQKFSNVSKLFYAFPSNLM